MQRDRISTGLPELDRVLGGGLVEGCIVLLAGEPGVGKSTLVLQAAAGMESMGRRVLLVCGEESPEQVADRARRLGTARHTMLTPATEVEAVVDLLAGTDVALVDSVQTLRDRRLPGEPGSVSQVRNCAAALTRAARRTGTAVVLVGHISKDGSIAGPRALEHLVDVVLTFEGDRTHLLRTLRGVKNRFGGTGELGVFEMGSGGLMEVPDASRLFLTERQCGVPGSAVGCVLEGRRPLALEMQALVVPTQAQQPRRVAQGIEPSRLGVALAVLQQRAGVRFADCDVYASVAGGLRAAEPGIDLALCLALASARLHRALPPGVAAIGEVGLAGEVRAVAGLEARTAELCRLGFTNILVPASHPERPSPGNPPENDCVQIAPVEKLHAALAVLGGSGHAESPERPLIAAPHMSLLP